MNKSVVKKNGNGKPPPAVYETSDDDVAIGGAVTSADMALPWLNVLHGTSGQMKKDNPNFLKGAAIGDIGLTVLNRFWSGDEGVEIVLCHYTRAFCERDPDVLTGPPINTYAATDPIVLNTPRGEKGRLILPNGHELQETAFHAVLVNVDGRWTRAVMPLRSTALKKSKELNNSVMSFEISDGKGGTKLAARWVQRWLMTTATATGGGNTWPTPVFKNIKNADGTVAIVDQPTYNIAKQWAIAAGGLTNLANVEAAAQEGKVEDTEVF